LIENILIPRISTFFPSSHTRTLAQSTVRNNPPEKFQSYQDWFFFIHIDPAQRYVHSIGMVIGTIFFMMLFIEWSYWSFLYYILGVFFFYVVGIISHLIYDKGEAKSHPRYFAVTFLTTIQFNLLTLFGMYDKKLREFLKKYPFVAEEYDLIEIKKSQLIFHLLTPGSRHDAGSK